MSRPGERWTASVVKRRGQWRRRLYLHGLIVSDTPAVSHEVALHTAIRAVGLGPLRPLA